MSLAFERALAALAQGSFESRELSPLSDLSLAKIPAFQTAWSNLPEATRIKAIRAMRELADASFEVNFARAFDVVIDNDPSPVARQLAIVGSFERDDADFVRTLLRVIDHDPSIDVRAAAARGLGPFCDLAVIGADAPVERLEPEIRARLGSLIEDEQEHPVVRGGALESVASFGSDGFVSPAIERLLESSDSSLRSSALIAMGRTCDRRWLADLLQELRSDDPSLRAAAAQACGRMGESDAVVSLGTAARDEDRDVRTVAIHALGEIGGTAAATILQRLTRNANREEQELIEAALAEATVLDDAEEASW